MEGVMATSPIQDTDTTQVIVDYLPHNPTSTHLANAPLGYLSLILDMYERELEGLLVFCDAIVFQSIVQETKSDVVQDMVHSFLFFATGD